MKHLTFCFLIAVLLLVSCKSENDFEITAFDPVVNFPSTKDTINLPMDLTDAVIDGIEIPSKSQCQSGYFKFSFEIINKTKEPEAFYYKIFYQNESYKYKEFIETENTKAYNPLSANNFYGSWDKANDGFHATPIIPNDQQYHLVADSFRITGNPRNEEKYFGAEAKMLRLSDAYIDKTIADIRKNPGWLKQVEEKAASNNVPLEEQLFQDALWVINADNQKGDQNNRWKRNPRVGCYNFILVVTTRDKLNEIPETIKDIGKSVNDTFINPYYDLLYNEDIIKTKQVSVIKATKVLKTYAEFDLGSGIYIDKTKFFSHPADTSFYSGNCGSSGNLFKRAQFEQYFHTIDKNIILQNIPLIYDVIGNNYTQADYQRNAVRFSEEELIQETVKITDTPGKTVHSDPHKGILQIINPGNNHKKYRKENVGINSRIGFTYGKFIAKIQFPAIINEDHVWNGLTCAYWLKFQDEHPWNNRSACDSAGYLQKDIIGPESPRLKTTSYSEIDFEILKTSRYWPKTSYHQQEKIPTDSPHTNHDIIVACTNWDLACRTPENFSVGATDFFNGNNHYTVHRWDHWYKALTIKHAINHDSIFNRPYYYEIEWQPDKIIWRIGRDKNNMIEIGYMDNTITTIPDNQMVIVFSQEFHDAKWWPLSPFIQNMIPFPKKDIIGEILEVIIE